MEVTVTFTARGFPGGTVANISSGLTTLQEGAGLGPKSTAVA